MKRSRGDYSKKGRKLKSKGRISVNSLLKKFEVGDFVKIDINPRFPNGRPALRFNHKIAQVIGTQGRAYVISLKDGGKSKTLLASNAHLSRLNVG